MRQHRSYGSDMRGRFTYTSVPVYCLKMAPANARGFNYPRARLHGFKVPYLSNSALTIFYTMYTSIKKVDYDETCTPFMLLPAGQFCLGAG
jgi:hypothetical protein